MIVWEPDRLDMFVHSIDEVVDCEAIGLVDVPGTSHRMQHWSNDDVWVDDC